MIGALLEHRYFDERRKSLFVKIAEVRPSDVLHDMGCADANLLIYSVRNGESCTCCGLREHAESRQKGQAANPGGLAARLPFRTLSGAG